MNSKLKEWAANGIRSEMYKLEQQIAKLRDQLKELVGVSSTGKRRGRPPGKKVAKPVATKKKTAAKKAKPAKSKGWTPERRKKQEDAIAARKAQGADNVAPEAAPDTELAHDEAVAAAPTVKE